MWLFEKRGFVSVVAYDPKKDRNKESAFRNIAKKSGTHLLVRARIEQDIDWLKAVDPGLVVETDAGADYAYRAVIRRSAFKKALALAVDGITYDSHFKEVARDNSPKAKGRYSAMMGVWDKMADLQPIAPWSGSKGWGGGWGWGKDKDDEFYADPLDPPETAYRNGGGPKTGFKAGDRVVGYSGAGEVVQVAAGEVERVTVKYDDGRTAIVLSNYLSAEPGNYDMDHVYEFAKQRLGPGADAQQVLAFPDADLKRLDKPAFDLLVRVQEAVEEGQDFGLDDLDEAYDEILWEVSSEEDRLTIWSDAAEVPAKYEADALKLFA